MSTRQPGENLDGLLSPFLRWRRIRAARPFIQGSVLDFGCGSGILGSVLPEPGSYVGVDIDPEALKAAAARNPSGRFIHVDAISSIMEERFDTVVALAVVEHLPDPLAFLKQAAEFLKEDGRIVLTTPDPRLDWAHGIGARLGIFARESHEEHQSLMGKRDLLEAASTAGLAVVCYRRFLFGVNQLMVLRR